MYGVELNWLPFDINTYACIYIWLLVFFFFLFIFDYVCRRWFTFNFIFGIVSSLLFRELLLPPLLPFIGQNWKYSMFWLIIEARKQIENRVGSAHWKTHIQSHLYPGDEKTDAAPHSTMYN